MVTVSSPSSPSTWPSAAWPAPTTHRSCSAISESFHKVMKHLGHKDPNAGEVNGEWGQDASGTGHHAATSHSLCPKNKRRIETELRQEWKTSGTQTTQRVMEQLPAALSTPQKIVNNTTSAGLHVLIFQNHSRFKSTFCGSVCKCTNNPRPKKLSFIR